MAEALSIAAPQGPNGFRCVDECQCQSSSKDLAHLLFTKVFQKLPPSTEMEFVKDGEAKINQLANAIAVDLLSPRTDVIPIADLADHEITVSDRSARVAVARINFPRTWQILREFLPRK